MAGDSHHSSEKKCLNYFGMLTLHEVFHIVGSQLTENDIEVLCFFLNETCTASHPLDPTDWTVEPDENDLIGVSPSPELLKAWRRIQPQNPKHQAVPSFKPKSGLELLLELERRGCLSDADLKPLLELLRIITRHDLLPLLSRKKKRAVSPERCAIRHGSHYGELVCASIMQPSSSEPEVVLPQAFTQQLNPGDEHRSLSGLTPRKRRKKRGYGWSRRPKKTQKPMKPLPPPPRVSCKIRLRVRAEYLEHESALREGVSSNKRQPLERQFELFGQATSLLRSRDLGSIACDIKFTDVKNLDAFWNDYLSGALMEVLKGVLITDSLRRVAGSEGIHLLVSVDQDDYEKGRKLLQNNSTT
ncbi:death effector domain-containing 1 [Synchiropus splendidus]|uniref:death effector domain-containing 1 n=1 Tax=Synchiropus splendidus TaxID=270530 RepID=UPI00237E965E|nr:death effector domain-containing 1 [Synchiropus splendidus]